MGSTELAEIDENLIRCNLTPAQEAQAIARRKVIYEAIHGKAHGGDRVSDDWKQNEKTSFCSDTAASSGKSTRAIEIAAARGKALGDDLNDIAGTSLDKGVELDALAKMEREERNEI